MIYHYTSIQTLELILQSRRIRFNRLDRVDDIQEAQTVAGVKFGQYFFVSCWSRSSIEQIPLWSMYTPGMQGVMIGMPDQPFLVKQVKPRPGFINEGGPVYDMIDLHEVFGPSYMIIPGYLDGFRKPSAIFAGDVTYVDDVATVYDKNVRLTRVGDKGHLEIGNVPSLVRTKSKYWAFQTEFRFALQIYPALPLPPGIPDPKFFEQSAQYTFQSMINSLDHGLTHYDMELAPESVDQIQVTLGPLCTAADRKTVEELLAKHLKAGTVTNSVLTGTIRAKAS